MEFNLTVFLTVHLVTTGALIHNFLLLIGVYSNQFGNLDVFSKLEALLWIANYGIYFFSYPITVNPEFIVNLVKHLNYLDVTWSKISGKGINQ